MSVSLPIDALVEGVLAHPVLMALSVVLALLAAYPLYTALRRPRDAPPMYRGGWLPIVGGAKAFIEYPLGAVFDAQKKVWRGRGASGKRQAVARACGGGGLMASLMCP
jgi:hypothetical protein